MDLSLYYAETLKSFPAGHYRHLFDFCHFVICVLGVRKEAGRQFAFERPAAAWACCIMASFAGSLIVNPLIGKPVLSALADEKLVALASLVYFLVFFAPGDSFYCLVRTPLVHSGICILKEVQRGYKVTNGLAEGSRFHPSSALAPILVATIKGNGSGFMTPFTRAVRGVWKPQENEAMRPSVTTKTCLLMAASLFFLKGPSADVVYLAAVGMFVSLKLSAVLDGPVDPFLPMERWIFGLLQFIAGKGSAPSDKKIK